ncbi:2'-5' RNA ligase family protein [Variovorax sp. NFACC27]|uniref:2'-5' RNA ligase family protein n=1 Tax=unclassified Variovorax TaxID=663243 RepID=UPI000894F7C0|nr:2'-5' RNA ligase family protein [Variovorax sp. YR750]SEF31997.1 2'-5' RNA ligase [Variovorax sp. NFACC28]SEG91874.1 2'-5' RNA ligase [Variovorax sp. NFACC29]SFD52496.1 2'-5' RNA ligase [Variovorax sp. NFACC26]SFG70882.1 2'-5' RNA ligase [Variovorax sp. NFACC27]SEL41833.1 2'-5' RNA ligase [Variovorax sp. YR750]
MAARRKLLIGLFPASEVQAEIAAHRKNWWWPRGCSFPPEERLHLTLQYLDDQHGDAEQRLRHALAEVSVRALELTLDSSCTWTNDVSVVQPSEHEKLRHLQRDISRALLRAGLSLRVPIRGWTPHITIARNAEHAARPTRLNPIRWTATEFRLVRSHFTSPFRHELLGSYPLH